jgi:uncharacterized repeat protein (TIGR01451 family)
VRVNADIPSGTVLINQATVTSSTPLTNPNVTVEEPATVEDPTGAPAALVIHKSSSGTILAVGEVVTYTLVITNHGPAVATDIKVVDSMPAGLNLLQVTSSQGMCVPGIVCFLGSITVFDPANPGAGGTATVTVVAQVAATVPKGTKLVNTAYVHSDQPNPTPGNAISNAEIIVGPISDLSLEKTSAITFTYLGDQIQYQIVVHNAGPSPAKDTWVIDLLPEGLSFVSATVPCTANDQTVRCELGTVAVDETVVFTITALASSCNGAINNVASVESDSYDPEPGGNQGNVSILCTAKPTFINLVGFYAIGSDTGIKIEWVTGLEFDTRGFHVWVSSSDKWESAERITPDLILAKGSDSYYSVLHDGVEEGTIVYYWLQEITLNGETKVHGPVALIKMQSGNTIYLPTVTAP